MREVPIKYVLKGDREAGMRYMRNGSVMMGMLQNFMGFRDLKQGVFRRYVNPDVLIECDCRFGLRTVTITVAPGAGGEDVEILRDCFANSTVALAYVLDVVDVEIMTPEQQEWYEWVKEPVCSMCIYVQGYPRNYYCTKGIRYTLAICDGKGEYVLYTLTKGASTDYTPRCPGDQVLVMQHRTSDLPEAVLAAANADPYAKTYFTHALAKHPRECVSILPFPVAMPKYNETEVRRYN